MNAVFDWLRSRLKGAASTQYASIDVAAAVRQASQLSTQDKGLAQDEFAQGNQQRESLHLEAAERHYRRALAIHPAFAEASANLGSLLKDRGALPEADQWLTLALALNPQLGPAYFNLAMMRIDQARWLEAADLLQRLLALSPNEANAYYWLGNA